MFPITNWPDINEATLSGTGNGRQALERLCSRYRPPVVSFLRQHGWNGTDAEDLAQDLFAKFINSRAWKKADPAKGRFRTFLLSILQHMIYTRRAHEKTQKNGSGKTVMSLDFLDENSGWEPEAPTPELTAEFDHAWAVRTLRSAFDKVQQNWEKKGRSREFAIYSSFLPGSRSIPTYAEVSAKLEITEVAARTAVSRLRMELGEALRHEIASTVSSPDDVAPEMKHLGAILFRPGSGV